MIRDTNDIWNEYVQYAWGQFTQVHVYNRARRNRRRKRQNTEAVRDKKKKPGSTRHKCSELTKTCLGPEASLFLSWSSSKYKKLCACLNLYKHNQDYRVWKYTASALHYSFIHSCLLSVWSPSGLRWIQCLSSGHHTHIRILLYI